MSPLSGALPVPLKPVRVSVPSLVSMTCGLPTQRLQLGDRQGDAADLDAGQTVRAADMIVPLVVSVCAGAGEAALEHVAWPVASALPLTATMLGAPSVVPLMVSVSVVVLGSLSASVIV